MRTFIVVTLLSASVMAADLPRVFVDAAETVDAGNAKDKAKHIDFGSAIFAQDGGDQIRMTVKEGQTVRVTDEAGQELQGKITGITPEGLRLRAHGKVSDIPYDRIVRIRRPADTLKNGALIGFAVGAALGVVALATYEEPEECSEVGGFYCGEPSGGGIVAGGLLLGGLGAAVGVGIDALIHGNP
jgi:hypothetical protein